MTDVGPTLETTRLTLRPTRAEDFEGWAALMADEASKFIGGPQPRSAAWRGFVSVAGAWAIQGYSMFSVIEKASGRWIGRVGPWVPEAWPGTEVGWGLNKDAYGHGYATEAAAASIDWAFETLGWTEVIHTIAPENLNSQAVAKRLGSTMLRSTTLPAPFAGVVVDVWGQSRSQWQAQRSRLPLRVT